MTDQPNIDRAEELRGLSDYKLVQLLGQLLGQLRSPWAQGFDPEGAAKEIGRVSAEWHRRCAEREARDAELERWRHEASRCCAGFVPTKVPEQEIRPSILREVRKGLHGLTKSQDANLSEATEAKAELERLREIREEAATSGPDRGATQ